MSPTTKPRADRLRAFVRRHWGKALLVVFTSACLWSAQVPVSLTAADRVAIEGAQLDAGCATTDTWERQLACVRSIQAVVARRMPDLRCVHEWGRTSHEPAAALSRQRGCCYTRARVIEKALQHAGLPIRHVSIHQRRGPWIVTVVRPGVPSHAFSEVLTERGWMMVDSTSEYVGLDEQGAPLSTLEVRERLARRTPFTGALPRELRQGDFYVTYGLYSRHGGFFPPFVPVPDVDWLQMAGNFSGSSWFAR